jgi:hypothetical protein
MLSELAKKPMEHQRDKLQALISLQTFNDVTTRPALLANLVLLLLWLAYEHVHACPRTLHFKYPNLRNS